MKKLNTLLKSLFLLLILVAAAGCEETWEYDSTPPAPPSGIITVTGDSRVDLSWNHNRESDLAGYNVYYNYSYEGEYTLIGSTSQNYFIDDGAVNGETYYYAVAAYDYNGNESELSYDVAYDTPRPEGFNQTVFDYLNFPATSGYRFKDYLVVPYDEAGDGADFFFENFSGTFYLNVWSDTDIQDMGATTDIYDVDFAPLSGYVPLIEGDNVKYTQAIIGHTYVIWTWDNHFAKIRIKQITNERMVFDWAYQTVEGEVELKMKPVPVERNKSIERIVNSR